MLELNKIFSSFQWPVTTNRAVCLRCVVKARFLVKYDVGSAYFAWLILFTNLLTVFFTFKCLHPIQAKLTRKAMVGSGTTINILIKFIVRMKTMVLNNLCTPRVRICEPERVSYQLHSVFTVSNPALLTQIMVKWNDGDSEKVRPALVSGTRKSVSSEWPSRWRVWPIP